MNLICTPFCANVLKNKQSRIIHRTAYRRIGIKAEAVTKVKMPAVQTSESSSRLKALIIGGGPGGTFAAIKLLKRGFVVDLIERFPEITGTESYAYSFYYSIDRRGIRAIQSVGLEIPKQIASDIEGALLHSAQGDRFVAYSNGTTILGVARGNLLSWLYDRAKEMGGDNLNLFMGWTFDSFDKDGQVARFRKSKINKKEFKNDEESDDTIMEIKDYDLLIGVDGVNSIVRKELARIDSVPDINQRLRFTQIEREMRFKVLPILKPCASLEELVKIRPKAIQAFRSSRFETAIIYVPAPDGSYSGVIFSPEDTKFRFSNWKTVEDVRSHFRNEFPSLYKMYEENGNDEFEFIFNTPMGKSGTSTFCSKFNYKNILLIGDAAHSMSPSLGQGCNSAFDDSFILDKIFDEISSLDADKIEQAFDKFTQIRKDEIQTMIKISSDPPLPGLSKDIKSKLRVFARIFTLIIANKIFPFINGPRVFSYFEDISYLELKKQIDDEEQRAFSILAAFVVLVSSVAYAIYLQF